MYLTKTTKGIFKLCRLYNFKIHCMYFNIWLVKYTLQSSKLIMVSQIYPSELHLNKANTSDTEAALLDLHLSVSNYVVSTKIYDNRDDFEFEIVIFHF